MISIDELASMIPVKPPIVKRKMKPKAQYIGAVIDIFLPVKVASQLKTLIPVGTAIIIVAVVK